MFAPGPCWAQRQTGPPGTEVISRSPARSRAGTPRKMADTVRVRLAIRLLALLLELQSLVSLNFFQRLRELIKGDFKTKQSKRRLCFVFFFFFFLIQGFIHESLRLILRSERSKPLASSLNNIQTHFLPLDRNLMALC